jgi:hypothetical protein
MDGELGQACDDALRRQGVKRAVPTLADVERVCYSRNARIFSLTPLSSRTVGAGRHHRPRFKWTITDRLADTA